MTHFRFVIPMKLDDLKTGAGEYDVYSVTHDYNAREVGHTLNDCFDKLKNEGISFILEDFDVFFSFIRCYHEFESKHKDLCWRIMYRAITKLESDLQLFFQEAHAHSSADERHKLCNTLKMIVYVFCSIMELFEEQDIKQKAHFDVDSESVQGKKKKTNKRSEESLDWQVNKEKGIATLLRLFSLPLHRVFNPPVVEEDLVNIITKCCYKFLENPSLTRHKDSSIMQDLFHIIGIAIEKHRQSLGFCLKMVQLLQLREQLVPILAQLIEIIVKKHNQRIIISELIREIKRMGDNVLSRESKAVSLFLVEVTERCPSHVLPTIGDLMIFLEQDDYMMRNATLSVIGHLVIKELSKDDLNQNERNLRDELLDKLEEHIHDNNSFTRSRALQVWSLLCEKEAIPLPRLETLIEIVVGRLRDKSCFCRKAAVTFLTQFLTKNPFAAKLPLHVLRQTYQKEEDKLKKLIETMEENESGQIDIKRSKIPFTQLEEEWNAIEEEFVEFWRDIETTSMSASENDTQNEENESVIDECNDPKEIFARFRDLVNKKKFKSALTLLHEIKKQFSSHEVFQREGDDDDDMTFIEEKSRSPSLPEAILLAKKLFFSSVETTLQEEGNDLGSREVEKDMEIKARVLYGQSQDQSESEDRTTTIEVARPSTVEDTLTNVSKQQILVKYLSDCVKFTEQIQIAIPLVCDLLISRNVTDVQESIQFFVSAYQFGVQDAIVGIRKMIVLIWSQEKSIRDSVIAAYKRIYLEVESDGENITKSAAAQVVKSLSELVIGATVGELISIEQILKEFMESGEIEQIHIQIMWERYSLKLSNTSREESIGAIQILGMIATSKPELIRSNLSTLITVGLGDRALLDSRLVVESCVALQKAYKLPKVESKDMFYRLPKNHDLFNGITNVLVSTLNNTKDVHWKMMCDEAVKVIFLLAENPDWICEQIIHKMLKEIMNESNIIEQSNNDEHVMENEENDANSQKSMEVDVDEQDERASQTQSQESNGDTNVITKPRAINSEVLARFVTLAGDVALYMLVHLDVNVLTELKIRNLMKEDKDKKVSKTPNRRKSRKETPKTPGDQNLEEEIGLAGANAVEDQEQEYLNSICNSEIVEGGNLLGRLSEMIVAIVRDPVSFSDIKLRTSACLSLAKYMAVSEPFCKKHLNLLFTILTKANEAIIRRNTIVALGDLCIRFPNLLDQWSDRMFERLRDSDDGVKSSTLRVLSRLILSDMLKVKGQISEIASLIVDEKESLSSSAKLFFTELGKKQNAIYNVLPDIISHLSNEDTLSEDKFQIVTKFCFALIEKDRQTVCLVEKLCQRFRATTDERQWRDLAFCLNLLTYSERSIQKLYENMISFADKLCIDFIHEQIMAIITNARKIPGLKNETKQMLDEFEQKVEQCRTRGVNEDESEIQTVVGTPPCASKRLMRLGNRPHTGVKARQVKNTPKPKGNPAKRGKTGKKKKDSSGSENENESEDENQEVTRHKEVASERPRREARTRKRVEQPVFSSDDES